MQMALTRESRHPPGLYQQRHVRPGQGPSTTVSSVTWRDGVQWIQWWGCLVGRR